MASSSTDMAVDLDERQMELDCALVLSRQMVIKRQRSASPLMSPAPSLSEHLMGSLSLDEAMMRLPSPEELAGEGEGMLSATQAIFNLANLIVGVGVLSVPYAFKQTGYFTLVIILLVIFITGTTGKWIGSALEMAVNSKEAETVPPRARDFAFLAQVTFGRWGRGFINAITVLEVWFACVTFMVMNGGNAWVLWAVSPTLSVPVTGAMAACLCFVPDGFFAYLSLVSSLSLLVAGVSMITSTYMLSNWAEPYDHLGDVALIQVKNIPQSVGIIVFCFAGHPCFPQVYTAMKQPVKWSFSVDVGFIVAFVFYGCLGFVGYIVFGAGLSASVIENLTTIKGTVALACRDIAALCFLVKVQLTTPFLLNAIMVGLWPPALGAHHWTPGRILLLVAVASATILVAVALKDEVAAVASLTGSACVMMTSVLFPAVVHLTLSCSHGETKQPRVPEALALVRYGCVIVFGAVMGVFGTAGAVQDLLAS